MGPSLDQRPNMILIHTGTNDVNPDPSISTEGDDPSGAAERLGDMLDKITDACPDATVLVAMPIDTCHKGQARKLVEFQSLIPGVVKERYDKGQQVLAANFTSFPVSMLRDCIHPTNPGYKVLGNYWYNVMTQVPKDWIRKPVGPDPERHDDDDDSSGTSRLHGGFCIIFAALTALLLSS